MKKTSITTIIAIFILLITGALFRVFAPENFTEKNLESEDLFFSSFTDNGDDPDSMEPAAGPLDDRDAAAQAVVKLDALKKRMADDGVDFSAMTKKLEERLRKAPDGKISEKDILGVVPPEYAEEFKTIINEMYYPGTINSKEIQQ